jgi:hypothetical protein
MAVEHGIKPPSAYLYPPKPKKPKNKRVKRSTEEGAAGMRSMPADNSCAYHLASMAIYATLHPHETDLDQWPSDAASARTIVVNKYFDMHERFEAFLDDAPVSDRSDQLMHWESMMSEGSAEALVDAAVDTTQWAGTVELAIAMDGTSTRIIIVLADLISDKATELDVMGAFQPALLYGLTEGASKTHDMFAILREGHYYLGYVRTQGVDRALFEVGDESESAKQLLIKHLKSVKGVAIRQKRKKGQIELASCLSDEDEPVGEASERAAEPPRRKTAAPRKQKHREEKDVSDASNEESKEYDVNQMVIYTHEDPTVLLVGSVLEVVGYDGFEGEFLLLHRYGYVSKKKAAWKLDYTKSFRPAYHDPKDDKFDFTFKPNSACTMVDHEIATTHVKAKFERTSKNRVPMGTVLSG